MPAPAERAPRLVEHHHLEGRSDDELMLLARSGLDGAFDALIRRHQRPVLRVAVRYLGEAALSADVAQNTFVALLRALPDYRAHGQFKAFLYRILLNQCRMARRSERSFQRALDQASNATAAGAHEVSLHEHRRDVEQALLRLSDKLREVVVLRFGADFNYDEIGETLGIPTGTVKRRLFSAKAKLREMLEEA
ncbi:MAG TPA: sigma-70 family RNA polymerase sigma factor [Polyangiaceae bacterium]